MKPNNSPITGFLRNFNPLCIAIALSMLMLAAIILLRGAVIYNGDTPSYISAWNECYSHGEIDIFRTPVYPLLIGVGKMLFGSEYGLLFPIIVQIITFYVCGIFFSRMISEIISNRRVALFTIFLYFLFYPVVNSLPLLTTEALGFSLTSLWIYFVWLFLKRASWNYGIAIAILTVIEIMLRPSFLILAFAIVGLAAAGIFIKSYRRQTLLLLLTLIPVGAVYKIYVDEMENRINMSTISVVSVYNEYYMARQYNDVFADLLTDDPQALKIMRNFQLSVDSMLNGDKNNALWREIATFENLGNSGLRQMKNYAMGVKEHHPDVWYSYILRRIATSLEKEGPVKNACNYLVVTIYTVLFVIVWIRRRHFSLVNFLTLMIGGGSLLSIFLYAQNDFGRLMLPTSAILILMGGQILNCLHLHRPRINLDGFFPKGETK